VGQILPCTYQFPKTETQKKESCEYEIITDSEPVSEHREDPRTAVYSQAKHLHKKTAQLLGCPWAE
jgi:hypothetical protein